MTCILLNRALQQNSTANEVKKMHVPMKTAETKDPLDQLDEVDRDFVVRFVSRAKRVGDFTSKNLLAILIDLSRPQLQSKQHGGKEKWNKGKTPFHDSMSPGLMFVTALLKNLGET